MRNAKLHAVAVILDSGAFPEEKYKKQWITPRQMIVHLGIRYHDGAAIKKCDIAHAIDYWHKTGSLLVPYSAYTDPKGEISSSASVLKRAAARVPKNKKDPGFYSTKEWVALRYEVLKRDGAKCACCGATKDSGVVLHVDHIKPRSLFPKLQLEITNLQVLCERCNLGKSNTDFTDWR